jgi:hypothetical protein
VAHELQRICKEASLKNLGIVLKFASRDSEKLLKTSALIASCRSRDSNRVLSEYKRTAIQLGCSMRNVRKKFYKISKTSSTPHVNFNVNLNCIYCHVCECDCRWVLNWWPDLLHAVILRVTTRYSSLLYKYTSVHSHVFAVVAWQRLQTVNVPLPLDSRTLPGLT